MHVLERHYTFPLERPRDVAAVAIAALLAVYDSDGRAYKNELAAQVAARSGYGGIDVAGVVGQLLTSQAQYLRETDDGGVIFGVAGLWMLEDAAMQSDPEIDGREVVEAQMRKANFFKYLEQ